MSKHISGLPEYMLEDPNPPQNEPDDDPELYQCDCCGKMCKPDELSFVRFDAPGNSAGCYTSICQACSDKAHPFSGSF